MLFLHNIFVYFWLNCIVCFINLNLTNVFSLFSYAIFKVLLAFYTVADSPAQLIDSSTRSLIHQIFCSLRRKIWEAQFRSHICLFAFAHANLELIAFDLPSISFSLSVEEIGSNHNRCG